VIDTRGPRHVVAVVVLGTERPEFELVVIEPERRLEVDRDERV
jgi:hypothetical protein